MPYLTQPNRLELQTFQVWLLLIEFQRHFIGRMIQFSPPGGKSSGTVEAFTVGMLVTGRINRLPEPVPAVAGTPSKKEQSQKQRQMRKTKRGG